MAPPQCESGDGQPAVFVGTFLATGQPVALCDECLVPWSAALLSAMTGVDPAPFLAAISEPSAGERNAAIDATEDTGGSDAIAGNPPAPTPIAGRTPRGSRAAGTATGPPGNNGATDQGHAAADA